MAQARAARQDGPPARVRLRRARPHDARELAALRWRFRASLDRPNESREAFVRRCASWMRRALLPRSGWLAWVVEERGRIVGHVFLFAIGKVPNPVPEAEIHAYVTNVYVLESHRGLGLGGRLMAAAVGWCEAHGVDSVVLWPTPRSRTLYARHGFAAPRELLERR